MLQSRYENGVSGLAINICELNFLIRCNQSHLVRILTSKYGVCDKRILFFSFFTILIHLAVIIG